MNEDIYTIKAIKTIIKLFIIKTYLIIPGSLNYELHLLLVL